MSSDYKKQESWAFRNLPGAEYEKRYPKEYAERRAKNDKLVKHKKKVGKDFVDVLNNVGSIFTKGNPILDPLRQAAHGLISEGLSDSSSSLVNRDNQ